MRSALIILCIGLVISQLQQKEEDEEETKEIDEQIYENSLLRLRDSAGMGCRQLYHRASARKLRARRVISVIENKRGTRITAACEDLMNQQLFHCRSRLFLFVCVNTV